MGDVSVISLRTRKCFGVQCYLGANAFFINKALFLFSVLTGGIHPLNTYIYQVIPYRIKHMQTKTNFLLFLCETSIWWLASAGTPLVLSVFQRGQDLHLSCREFVQAKCNRQVTTVLYKWR